MADFAEYAALARHLHELHRAVERGAEQDAQQRTATGAAISQLGHRLAAQHQRLTGLAQSIGKPAPGAPPGAMLPSPPLPPPGAGLPPGHHAPPAGPAYPKLPAGAPRLALPINPSGGPINPGGGPANLVASGGPWSVPGQRPPASPGAPPTSDAGMPYAVTADPDQEVTLARQRADAADAALHRAEVLAGQPRLLPAWSPLARSVGVYAGFAAGVAVIHWLLLAITKFDRIAVEKVDFGETFSLFAWSCAGLPAMAFFAGYLVLKTWGKPRIGTDDSGEHARLGFLICFLATPLAFCFYSLIL